MKYHLQVVTFLIVLLAGLFLGGVLAVQAQTSEEVWREPQNLSESGAVAARQLVPLGNEFLVFWRDEIDGYFYTRGRGSQWREPERVVFLLAGAEHDGREAPGGGRVRRPDLVADGEGMLHAIWQDSDGGLYYGRVPVEELGAGFDASQELAPAAVGADLMVDERGRLHLIFLYPMGDVSTEGAGVYYRRSVDGGASWTAPVVLDSSAYYRLLSADEANVKLASKGSGDLTTLYAAWDDPVQERVYVSRSADAGLTWAAAEVVDRREERDSSSAEGPHGIRVAAAGSEVHLAWQAGHEGLTCAQYHIVSTDSGRTWEQREQIFAELGCPLSVRLFTSQGSFFLLAETESALYLSTWHDGGWSEPERQEIFDGFMDVETQLPVTFNCGFSAAAQDGQLALAACGDQGWRDIWFTSRPLAPLLESARVTPVWSTPAAVFEAAATEGGDGVVIQSPVLLSDSEGTFHALWSEADGTAAGPFTAVGSEIVYARFAGGRWSRPIAIVESGGMAEAPAVALTRSGRLVAVWSGGGNGEIFTSWAAVARASVASEWTTPQELSAPRTAGSAPDVAVEPQSGVVYGVYAVPLNEERGIYLTASTDGGERWSEATQVLDAEAADWEMVDRPQLAISGPDDLHLLFRRQGLPGNVAVAQLYYARSNDGGITWSEPEEVENGTPQSGPAVWSELVAVGARVVHRAWQEWDGRQLNLWHQVSADNGATWSRAAQVGGFGSAGGGPAALVKDSADQVYLLSFGRSGSAVTAGEAAIQLWQWAAEEERWLEAEGLAVEVAGARGGALAAAVAPDGHLGALVIDGDGETEQVLFVGRDVALPETLPTPRPTLTPTPIATATPMPTATPGATPTPVFSTVADSRGVDLTGLIPLPAGGDVVAGAVLAALPALLIVGLAVALYVRYRPGRR